MATPWTSISAGIAVICTLLVLSSALPTDPNSDAAVRLRHANTKAAPDRPVPDHPSFAALSPQQPVASSSVSSPNAGPPAHPGASRVPIPATLHTGSGSNRVPAPAAVPSAVNTPSNTAPAAPQSSAPENPFTNHFVLDTANLDLDGDGCIAGEPELDLFKYHVATALAGSRNNLLRAHSIVHRTDTNKDGRICWCDFISIYLHDKDELNKHHRTAPFVVMLDRDSGMFSRLDTDQDKLLKGPELDSLTEQFASCIPEEQARLIVAAMTGLGQRDGAISNEEFNRFLGMELNQTSAHAPTADNNGQPSRHLPSGSGEQPKQQSEISGVRLTSTALPPQQVRGAAQNNMASTENQ